MNLRKIRFGIEIETVKRTRKEVADAIQSVVGGQAHHRGRPTCFDPWEVNDEQGRVWRVDSDSSLIDAPPALRAELVSPVLGYDDIAMLQEVIRSVRFCGAETSRQCGIHIHVDAAPFNGKTLGNLAKIVYKQEPLIFNALGISDARRSDHSRPVSDALISSIEQHRPRTKRQFNRVWYGYHNSRPNRYDSTRYHGVNLHSVWQRGTVEFRWFEGTLQAGKIKAYIQLVLAIAAKALNGRAASSRKRKLEQQSARYDFRVFLLRLGLIGNEFKTARKHLLADLPGDSAFKRGRPKPRTMDNAESGLERQPSRPLGDEATTIEHGGRES